MKPKKNQSSLFGDDNSSYPVQPYKDVTRRRHRGNPESREANRRIAPHKNAIRQKIYLWWKQNGPAITEAALDAMPEILYPTMTARVSELKRDQFLEKVGTHNTRSGSPAALLQVTDKPYPFE